MYPGRDVSPGLGLPALGHVVFQGLGDQVDHMLSLPDGHELELHVEFRGNETVEAAGLGAGGLVHEGLLVLPVALVGVSSNCHGTWPPVLP